MKKQILLQENLLKKINYFLLIVIFLLFFNPNPVYGKEKWIMDKELSRINFEIPVLFTKNVVGKFNEINGYVDIDIDNKTNNKAIFSVKIDSIEMNYEKYRDLVLSEIFFNKNNFPIAVIDTKKFTYENKKEILLEAELTIKGKSKEIPLIINVNKITEELVQIKTELIFSRSEFNIGKGKWSNTTILKDNIKIISNLFLFKQ